MLSKDDIPIGTALMFFGQTLGSSVFLAVAQNIFSNKLVDRVLTIMGFDGPAVLASGATEFGQFLPA